MGLKKPRSSADEVLWSGSMARRRTRPGTRLPSTTWIGLALAMVPIACSEGRPVGADLPEIMYEAAAEDPAVTGGSPARRAVRDALRHVVQADRKYAAEIGRRFQRQELYSYLFLSESYIGGTFPQGTATLLREVEQLEAEYLADLHGFRELLSANLAKNGLSAGEQATVVDEMAGTFEMRRQPMMAAVESHSRFVDAAAQLYEHVASEAESIRLMRHGLEFSDSRLGERFDSHVAAVNSAHEAADDAIQALVPDLRASLHWMKLAKCPPR